MRLNGQQGGLNQSGGMLLDTAIEISVFCVYSVDQRATAIVTGRIWEAIYDLARDCHTTHG